MKRAPLLSLLGFAAGLCCLALPSNAQTPISVGQTISGNLTAAAPARSSGRAGQYADLYRFTIASPQPLVLRMSSDIFDTYLQILDSNGAVIVNDDDSGGETNSRIDRVFGAGTYVIEATSYSPEATGAYSLSLSGQATTPISVGQTVNGTLSESSARSSGCGGCYADVYMITLPAAQEVIITHTSSAFDAFLRVVDANGALVVADDDGGGGTNSRIQHTFPAGAYRIEATTYHNGNSGGYVLSVRAPDTVGTLINVGQSRNGTLNAQSGRSSGCSGCFSDLYRFTLTSSQTVQIGLSSAAFDAFLRVLDAGGQAVKVDDDSGGGANGTDSLLTHTFPAGTYRIEATTYSSGQSGAYALTLQALLPNTAVIPVTVGQQRSGSLVPGSNRSGACADCYADFYQLTLTAPQDLVIAMDSSAFDALLRVLDSAGAVVATDDDSGGRRNARIARRFAAGAYRIEATTYSGGDVGAYTLSVTLAPPLILRPINVGQSVSGSLTAAANRSVACGACYADLYTFTLSAPQALVISMESDVFDVLLRVLDANGVTVAADDDGAGGTNARIAQTLPAGSYRVEATSYSSGATGAYAFSLLVRSGPLPPVLTALAPSSQPAGNEAFTLAVLGAHFTSSSVVRWNGSDRPTVLRGSELQASITGADIAAAGTARVTVFTPAPGGGASNALIFTITTGAPELGVSNDFLVFRMSQGGANPEPLPLIIRNLGRGSLQWTAAVSSSGNWLGISATSGATSGANPATVSVSVNGGSLAAGVHVGFINLRDAAGNPKQVAVLLIIRRADPVLRATQSGFLFQGIEGEGSIPAQTVQLLNTGEGTMNWRVRAETSDGRNWLAVTPPTGSSAAGAANVAPVALRVDASQLRAGTYTALVTFEAPGAQNAPASALVLVSIAPPGSDTLGTVQPAGFTFVGTAGGASPPPQSLQLTGLGGKQIQYSTAVRTDTGGNWLSVTPASGALPDTGAPVTVSVRASSGGLAAGIYNGAVTVTLSTGKVQVVGVVLVVTATAVAGTLNDPVENDGRPVEAARVGGAADCVPTRLALVETVLAGNFSLAVRWPVTMRVQVVNDCGQAVRGANVTAAFSNGDGALRMDELQTGQYVKTWSPVNTAQSLVVTMRALSSGLSEGLLRIEGKVTAAGGAPRPLVSPNGVVNGASFAAFQPLAPGSIFSLFGQNLAPSVAAASSVPLPTQLNTLRVTIGGRPVPLFYVSATQVNGQVPFDLTPGTNATVAVSVNNVPAQPQEVTIASAHPGIFLAGGTQGAILSASNQLVNASNPVAAGEVIVIYATGLGATTPGVVSGEPSPSSPVARLVTPAAVSIGGRDAPVEFYGLAPGFVGLYQVNARVPAGVTPGNAVPVVITQAGVSSNAATIAVR